MPLYTPPRTRIPVPASGNYFLPLSPQSTNTSATLGVGTLRVAAWVLDYPIALSRLGAEVTVIGDVGSKVRLGIYADNGNGVPGSLLLDAGQIAGDSATTQELTVSITLAAGVYWLGGVVQTVTTTQPTVRLLNVDYDPQVLLTAGTTLATVQAGAAMGGYSVTGVTGALPATFGTPSTTGNVPRLLAKVA